MWKKNAHILWLKSTLHTTPHHISCASQFDCVHLISINCICVRIIIKRTFIVHLVGIPNLIRSFKHFIHLFLQLIAFYIYDSFKPANYRFEMCTGEYL